MLAPREIFWKLLQGALGQLGGVINWSLPQAEPLSSVCFQEIMYRWSPTYNGSTYNFFTLWWCRSYTHSVETMLWILNFELFPFPQASEGLHNTLLLMVAASCSFQVIRALSRVKYTDTHSVPIRQFWFSLPVQYSVNYVRYPTLYYYK